MRQSRSITKPSPKLTTALMLACLLMAAVATQPLQAQTLRLLHSFKGPEGEFPLASMIRDSAGNLYGTTNNGGTSGNGTVFKLSKGHILSVLHNFAGSPNDGANPQAALLRDAAGNLYGTTVDGGAAGGGTVYEIDASGTETVLYSFIGQGDGIYPLGNLVRDKMGNLYSTTSALVPDNTGTVFKLDKTGKLTTLYTFSAGAGGNTPTGNLVRDGSGNLYGTCEFGGENAYGTVYKLDMTGNLTVLHSFDETVGAPYGGLIADAEGNLYGSTSGAVFQITEATGVFTLLHTFVPRTEGTESYATVARDAAGNLYGANNQLGGGCHDGGCGTIWKLDTSSLLTVLTNFGEGNRGKFPRGGVVLDKAGNLYGTTSEGGGGCRYCGTVFEITP
jgi:uncharacterized repeat protein (TIGR03803 family)